ncbi:MAG: translocation/assembly module TamB domain-containing protein [Rhodomicrobiaceae bacterium]
MTRAVKYLAAGIAGLLAILLVTAFLLAATGPGQRGLLRVAEWAASSDDLTVSIGGLEGSLFSEGHISNIALGDADGVWAEIETIGFTWSPWRLLGGTADIERIEIGRVEIRRTPRETAAAEKASAPSPEGQGSAFVPPPLRLERLSVGEIVLGAPVLGEAARLSLDARLEAADPAEAISGHFVLADLDRPNFIKADINYLAGTGSLEIAARAEEKAGGILTTLLDMKDSGELRLALNGSGPIHDWKGDWTFASGQSQLASGSLKLDREDDGLRIATEAQGEIARLVPAPYAALLAGNTELRASALIGDDRTYRLTQFQLDALRLKAVAAGRINLADNSMEGHAELRLVDRADEAPFSFPLTEGETVALREASVTLSAKPDKDGTAISAKLDAGGIAAFGNEAGRVSVNVSAHQPGNVASLLERLDAISASAVVTKAEPAHPALKPLLGHEARLEFAGTKSGGRVEVSKATLSAAFGSATAQGVVDGEGFDGEIGLAVPDAAPLSRLAGRELSGSLNAKLAGQAYFDGRVALTVEGKGSEIAAGSDPLGQLLAGSPALTGSVTRREGGGMQFDDLALKSAALDFGLNGALGAEASDLSVAGRIDDLARILPDSSGPLRFEAALEGKGDAQKATVSLSADETTLRGQQMRNLKIGYEGVGGLHIQQGRFSANGDIGDSQLIGAGEISFGTPGGDSIRGFSISLGDNTLEADGVLPDNGDARGQARLRIADASQLSPILGVPLEGTVELDAQLSGTVEAAQLAIDAKSDSFRHDTITLKAASAAFTIADALKQPLISGRTQIQSINAGDAQIADLDLTAAPEDGRTALNVTALIDGRWRVKCGALAALPDWQPSAVLRDISVSNGEARLEQEGEAQLVADDAGVRLERFILATGKGRISADVTMSDTISGQVRVSQFPARFAEIFAPDLSPRGTIEATIDLGGTAAAPEIGYKISVRQAAIAGALPPTFPALDLSAMGTLRDDLLDLDARISGSGGLALNANGSIRDVSAGGTLDIATSGSVPLALAEPFLAARGTRISGPAKVELKISGAVAKPVINGRITANGVTVKDPPTDIDLKDATLTARLADGTLRIETLTARSEKGGEVSASGTIGVLTSDTVPVDLNVRTSELRFSDRRVVSGQIGSDMTFTGNLLGRSEIGGTFDIARLDIQIPQSLPSSVEALELKHKNAPEHVQALQPPQTEPENGNSLPSSIALSLDIRAANRIFVKGRGVDAQLGGELRLIGTADKPSAVGQFTLERGRLTALGRTLDFTSGSVTFSGDLDPQLSFVAATEVDGIRIEIAITGVASDPKFGFSSNPELPEDEILALLLFNKSLANLSPLQIVQLASEVSELGGLSGGPGVLGRLRSGIGIDTLNLTTDEDGEVAVSAGSYLNENVYVGVEQGSASDSSRVKIDLDITKNLKLRGEAGADGKSKLGVGVEWEY